VPRRRDTARATMRSYRSQAAHRSGFHAARATLRRGWYRLPGPVRRFGPAIVVLIVAVLYPYYLSSLPSGNVPLIYSFPSVRSAVTIIVFTMMAVGLNVVVGYCGLLDLGYVAFYAIGAYSAGWLASGQFQQVKFHFGSVGVTHDARGIHISIWLVLILAAMLTALGGILIGLPTLRLRGDYLAIVTLGFGEIIPQFVRNADSLHGFDLTHGTFGISPIDSPGFGNSLHKSVGLPTAYSQQFNADRLFYWTAILLLILTIVSCIQLRDSRLGRAWIAIREDETAAGAMGIPLMRTKTWAYAIGAFFGGAAGAYIATFNAGAFPSQFSFNISVFLLCMVILGGMGSIWGVVVAGGILAWLNVEGLANIGTWLNDNIFPESHQIEVAKYQFGIYGVIIVLMMMFRPQGLIPEARRKREIEEGGRGALDEPLYEMRGADEPGAGERGAPEQPVPRG
jgi:branched-chain amino acid transport system permease protein